MADQPTSPPPARKLSSLRIVWHYATRYPLQLALAMVALLFAAGATLWIPRTFKEVVDKGFASGADPSAIGPYFEGLLGVVVVLALATAMRFYFVSWLG